MDLMKPVVVALAGWMNQRQQAASGLADCFATTTGMRHEIDDSNLWTLRDELGGGEGAKAPSARRRRSEKQDRGMIEGAEIVDRSLMMSIGLAHKALDRIPARSEFGPVTKRPLACNGRACRAA